MKNFSVLLLYPDYLTENFGHETYLAHVKALTPRKAIQAARVQCRRGTPEIADKKDLYVLAVFKGKLEDLQYE
jgi:hypothetical protein